MSNAERNELQDERWGDLLTLEQREDRVLHHWNARMETRVQLAEAMRIGKPILAQSNLVQKEAPLDATDVEAVLAFLKDLQKQKGPAYGPMLDHLQLTGKFAGRIAQQLNDRQHGELNVYEIEIRGLFHDIGRLMGQRRYIRHDLEGMALLKRLGVRDGLAGMARVGDDFQSIDELSVEEKIVMLADICGKRDGGGVVRSFDGTMQHHYASRKTPQAYLDAHGLKQPLFASELRGFKTLDQDVVRYGELYENLREWAQHQGIDIERIRLEINGEENARVLARTYVMYPHLP